MFCAGCAHRASFYAFKQAAKGRNVLFSGDIGCYTLGASPPLKALDTCLCMGGGMGLAQGLARIQPDTRLVAFIGDSTFFHAGLPSLVNAVHQNTSLVTVILDNETTAMTGHQPTPGLDDTGGSRVIDIGRLSSACGVEKVLEADPLDLEGSIKTAQEALQTPGPVVVIFRSPCVQLSKPSRRFQIIKDNCSNCLTCINELGCPALEPREETVAINATCAGCGLCAAVCPVAAIEEVK